MKFTGSLLSSALLLIAINLYGQVEVPRFFNVTSNDAITGSATLTKTGAGTLWLTSPSDNTFSGDITVGVDGGTLRIGGNTLYTAGTEREGATLPYMTSANTITIRNGGVFYIQDNAANSSVGYIADRLGSEGDRPGVRLEGGTFTVIGPNTANLQSTQSVGQVTLASGASIINVGRVSPTATAKLFAESLSLTPGAYAQFTGTILGTLEEKVSQIYFNTLPLIGGGGAEGSTTMSIVPGTRYGNDLVTYGTYGIRALTASEYKITSDINLAGSTDNVKLESGALAALSGNVTVNALAITGGNSPWNLGEGNTLTLTSGQLFSTPTIILDQGVLTAGTGDDTDFDIVTTVGTLTLNANIVDNGAGKIKLVKNGARTLTLNPTTDNTYSGGTVINEGTLSTSGTTDGLLFFGTGPVLVDNAWLTMTAAGSTAYSTGDDYTAVNAGQVTIANRSYTADDTFNISADSVISGGSGADTGLNSLDRADNITLASDAVVAHGSLATTFDPDIHTIKNLGTSSDLFFGINYIQNSALGNITVGSDTPFKGVSSDRSNRSWYLGTLNVATGTDDIFLQGLPIPGAAPATLTLGNGALDGGPVFDLGGNGMVNAHVLGYVSLYDDMAIYGDTSAGDILNFVVDSGAQLTVNLQDSMGSGTGIATAQVKNGGTLAIGTTVANTPWASINGAVTVEDGGRMTANNVMGLFGTGMLNFQKDSILDITIGTGFSGPQAAAATVNPGTIVRLSTVYGSATDPLDNYLSDKSPIYEVYNGNRYPANPLSAGTTIMTLNRDANGVGGMLINDDATRTFGSTLAANGVIAIGPKGGIIAATSLSTLTVSQPIALSSNELIIGSMEILNGVMLPKLGTVILSAGSGYSTATKGSRITIIPGAQLNNIANSLPDLAEVAVGGTFYVAGSDTIGALSGTGLVSLANYADLTVGCNDADTTFSGVLINGNTACDLIKVGAGCFDLTADQDTFTGTVRIIGGELALSGDGKLSQTGTAAFTLAEGGVLHLDNSDANLNDRLTGAAPGVTFQGGTFRLTGTDGEASSESLGAATFSFGNSTIDMVNGSGAGSSSEVIFSAMTANPLGTVNFTASNGTLGMSGDNPRVKFTSGVAAGLLGWGTVGSAPAYYDTTDGVRAFDRTEGTEFDGTIAQTGINTLFSTANEYPVLTASRTVNSLWIDAPGSDKFIDLGSGNYNLSLTSGRLLLTGTDNFTIKRSGTGSLTGTPAYLYLGVDDPDTTLTLSVPSAKAIQKDGAGMLIMDAALTGALVINNGTMKYGADGDLAGALNIANGGIFDMTGMTDTLGALTIYAGGITNSVAGGALTIGALNMGSGSAGSSARIDTGSGTLNLGGTVTYSVVNDPDMATIAGNLNLNGGTRTFAINDSVASGAYIDLDVPATLTGATGQGIVKTGTGTMRLSGANTFDGPVTVTGTLRLSNPQALGLPTPDEKITVNNGSSLVLDDMNGAINLPLGYTTLSLYGTGNTFLGPVSGALVNGSGNNTVPSTITLAYHTTIASLAGKLTLSGNFNTGTARTLSITGDGDIDLNGTVSTCVSTLTKYGAGTLTLKGANTFTGITTINAGVVNVQHNTGLGTTAGATTVAIGGELQLQGGITVGTEALTLNGTGVAGGGALRNVSGINSYAGAITLAMPDVRINSDAGILKLNATTGNAIGGNYYNVIFGGEGDIEISRPIVTSTGGLTKDGSGTLTLDEVNAYTGTTTVEDGTLNVNGSLHASSDVAVNNGAKLGGTGNCLGTVTAASGATVALGVNGEAGGTLTIATLSLDAGSICAFEIADAPANDTLIVSDADGLTIAPGVGIALYAEGTANAWATLGTYNLIQYSGELNGSIDNLSLVNPHPDMTYTFVDEGGWISLKLQACIVSALPPTLLTMTGGQLKGLMVAAGTEKPSVYFCLDESDKGIASTNAWAHVYPAGTYGTGETFNKNVTDLLSGSNYTYRCFAVNSVGENWSDEAVSFKPVYLPSVVNTGARGVAPGVALLQGEVTDTGSEPPHVWFMYWQSGTTTTNVIDVGIQTGACSTQISGLPLGASYSYMLKASNLAGVVYSDVKPFAAATIYHVSLDGDDSNNGLSWENAFLTINFAANVAQDGDNILVTDGTYTITEQITLDKAVTLVSVNGREVTDIVGNNTFRLLYLNHPTALVSGFTLSKGRANTDLLGGGFAIDTLGGTVQDCRVTNCNGIGGTTALYGVAIHQAAGKVTRCLIDKTTYGYGKNGTVYLSGGLIENSVIANNKMHNDGGGLYLVGGTARNCTIVDNESSRNGCGVYLDTKGTGRIENCIVWDNIHRIDPTLESRNIYGATPETVINCCTPEAVGSDAITAEPRFIDAANGDYRLQASSPCIDAGATFVNTSTFDVGGGQRVIGSDIDIGAHEFDTTVFACGFLPSVTRGLTPLNTTFISTVFGASSPTNLLDYTWTISDGLSEDDLVNGVGLSVLNRTLDAGWYTVTLEVTDLVTSDTALSVLTHAVGVSPAILYVAAENANTCSPYTTWETAATNLHEALALAWDGATIVVSNGTYAIAQQLIFDRNITMQSVNGFDTTTIQAPIISAVRVLTLSHPDARVEGFTLRDGRGANGNPGGGVLIGVAGGTLFNCRVTENACGSYDAHGGGIRLNGGRVTSCIIDANRLTLDSMQGCGIYQTGGILENCLIITNLSYSLTQNTGGGVNLNGSGIVRNCTIIGNSAARGGGITRNGTDSMIQNCIIVDNLTGSDTGPGAPNWLNADATAYQNVCTPADVGVGCITANPEFIDAEANNYQLRLGSPCIDTGIAIAELPEKDLAGNPRVTGLGVDIGAYEYDARNLSCGITVSPASAATQAEVQLTASLFGFDSETNNLHYTWILDDVAGWPVQSGMGQSVVQQTYDTLGRYHVRLTVSELSSGKSVYTVLSNAVHIAPATLYLVQSNATPVAPYNTWNKAATNIHEVVAEAVGGSTVLIANGTYDVTKTIALNEGIVLRGVNGWATTTLKGQKVAGVRILDIDHPDAIAEGLTIRGGKTVSIGFGGGVNIADGTLRRCLITDNDQGGYSRGCGINQIGGLVTGCIISNNAVCSTGGGISISGGILESSLITASAAGTGGGVQISGNSIMRNCTITGNDATGAGETTGHGGGVWRDRGGSIINCIIWRNTAKNETYEGYPDWSGSDATAYSNNCTSVEVGANCIVEDPLFKNVSKQDYRIELNSPCRDQGLYQDWMAEATDLWGTPRVDAKHLVDIGAHEIPAPLPSLLLVR